MRWPASWRTLGAEKRLAPAARPSIRRADLAFNFTDVLPLHTNGLRFRALDAAGAILDSEIYYSVGGGFVVTEAEARALGAGGGLPPALCERGRPPRALRAATGLTIAEVQFANECGTRAAGGGGGRARCHPRRDVRLHRPGPAPGRRTARRPQGAPARQAAARRPDGGAPANARPAHEIVDWISLYALAVNEENAAGGRVVTAPTNGAAGIVPAVLRYARDFCPDWSEARAPRIPAHRRGGGRPDQDPRVDLGGRGRLPGRGRLGAAMAAAGLAAFLGGSPAQVENAAEIAMEHHLGMTCDPIGGLVQIPCIERNAFGANKAVVAASLALRGDGIHRVTPRRGHRDHAPDRPRHAGEVQGDLPRWPRGERRGLLRLTA